MPARGGALLVDKPVGPTSHDVVAWARKVLGTKRVGHTGTLEQELRVLHDEFRRHDALVRERGQGLSLDDALLSADDLQQQGCRIGELAQQLDGP